MQFAMDLWMPILVSGLAVFVVSALAWTVFPHHKKEYGKLSNEDAVMEGGMPGMGPKRAKSFLFHIFVAGMVAYVGWHTMPAGTDYLPVFRVTGSMAFMAYALGTVPESIWFSRPWSSWLLGAFDSMLYALVLAGIFGWLWP